MTGGGGRAKEERNFIEGFTLPDRVLRSLDQVDKMSPELKECVHEFGYAIVSALQNAGVKDPARMRQLVHEIWMGARQPVQRSSVGTKHSPVLDTIDWLLIQSGAQISAKTLLRLLWANHMVVLPRDAGNVMVEASLAEVSSFNVRCTKFEKHRRRLHAAMTAQARRLWPHLFADA